MLREHPSCDRAEIAGSARRKTDTCHDIDLIATSDSPKELAAHIAGYKSIANAGKPGTDFPINVDIQRGKFGSAPFAETHWVMVCGQHDPHPDRDGCSGMREARDWVTTYGGVVDLLIEDPDGDHGAFHKNPANVNAALDVFATRLEATKD